MTRPELIEAMALAISEATLEWGDDPAEVWDCHRMTATEALAAIEATGHAVVPREATDAMISAASGRPQPDPEPIMYLAIYRAMVAAGPVETRDA